MKKILFMVLAFMMILSSCIKSPSISDDTNDKPQDDLPQEDIVFDEKGWIDFYTSDDLKEFFNLLSTFDGNVFEWGDKKISPDTAKKMLEFKDCKILFYPKDILGNPDSNQHGSTYVLLAWDNSENKCFIRASTANGSLDYFIYKEIPQNELENINAFSNNPNKVKLEIGDKEFFVVQKSKYTYRGYSSLDDYTVRIDIGPSYSGLDGLELFSKRQYRFFYIDELNYVYDRDYWEIVD